LGQADAADAELARHTGTEYTLASMWSELLDMPTGPSAATTTSSPWERIRCWPFGPFRRPRCAASNLPLHAMLSRPTLQSLAEGGKTAALWMEKEHAMRLRAGQDQQRN